MNRSTLLPAWFALLLSPAVATANPVHPESSPAAEEASEEALVVRPHAGIGWSRGLHQDVGGLAVHAGARVLSSASLAEGVKARFGLEATVLDLDGSSEETFSERYIAAGIVLEMVLFGQFNLGIGTLGYVGIAGTDRNPFGLMTNLGWEPSWRSSVVPYATVRSELIFDEVVFIVLSPSIGLTLRI